ncbi:MAG: RDD family protein [Rhodospirillales bacterium]|nr:RDD family protein [Rhodospirillales bacterium]
MAAVEGAPPGGFWIRFVAYVIDGLVLSVPLAMGIVALVVLHGARWSDPEEAGVIVGTTALLFIALIVINWLYEALMTSSPRGATLGKMALGLRIVRFDGTRLSFGRATGRHFAKYMVTPMVPLAIGYIMAAFTSRKRALHDILADTLVIRSS